MKFTPYIARDRRFQETSFDFWISDETGRSWYDSSPNQYMTERDWCRRHLRPGVTVVDCGSHHGLMSVLFSKWVGPSGRVIAYEALPSNAEVVSKNAALNQLTNLTVRPVGVGQESTTVSISINAGNTVIGDSHHQTERIDLVALDTDLDPDLRIDFLKIDVEGHELQALKGARRILQQRPIVVLELHNFLFGNRAKALAQIMSEVSSAYWTFEVQGEVLDVDFRKFDGPIDLDWLGSFDNPHVFCTPRKVARPRNRWFDWQSPMLYRAALKLGRSTGLLESEPPSTPTSTRDAFSCEQMLVLLHLGVTGTTPDVSALSKMRSDVVGRPAKETEQAALIRVTASLTRRSLVDAGATDAERIVRRFYSNLFGRSPDPEGLAYWTKELSSALQASVVVADRFAAAAAEVLYAIIRAARAEDHAMLSVKAENHSRD